MNTETLGENPDMEQQEVIESAKSEVDFGIEKADAPEKHEETEYVSLLDYNLEREKDLQELSVLIDEMVELYLDSEDEDDQKALREVIGGIIRNKDNLIGKDNEASVSEMVEGIIEVEQRIISNFKQEIRASADDDFNKQKARDTVRNVRTALTEIILNGYISGKKICTFIDSIRYKHSDEEASSRDIEIFSHYVQEGDKNYIELYENFTTRDDSEQIHIIDHELSHALCESSNMWSPPGIYDQFISTARSGDLARIREIESQNPALAELLLVVHKPDLNSNDGKIWNDYIRTLLDNLSQMPENEGKGELRVAIARELAAEMTASFLKSDGTVASYLSSRLKFCGGSSEISEYIAKKTGCLNTDQFFEFCKERGVYIDSDTSEEDIITKLGSIPELATLFRSNNRWLETLTKSLAPSVQIQRYDPNILRIPEGKFKKVEKKAIVGALGDSDSDPAKGAKTVIITDFVLDFLQDGKR